MTLVKCPDRACDHNVDETCVAPEIEMVMTEMNGHYVLMICLEGGEQIGNENLQRMQG